MSIESAIAAEYGEIKRKEWVEKLKVAYYNKNWTSIKSLLEEMESFYFAE